ncbi:MAG TPA: GDP-mannose 4,6-dehydratase [Gemmatimonadaceae bacterium]|nr:GDP-mannose 4,6-dehydratase [Gemmatimonadaceae bacterium]
MRALVTGAAGFAGQWLCHTLLRDGWDVWGLTLDVPTVTAVLSADERAQVAWRAGDVRDQETLAAALEASRPDAVFHLAGVSFVPQAEAEPGPALETNVVACAKLLAEVRRRRAAGTLDPAVLVVGSGEQYGRHDAAELPLPESAEQRPLSTYAATKAAQEVLALQAHRRDGVRVVCTRSFNHVGRGQDARFLLPSLVQRTLALRGTDDARLLLGNTTPVRDFAHVSDVVRAYIQLAAVGEPGRAYNVCSGQGWSVAAVAELVASRVGVRVRLEEDPALVRPVDVPALVGDPSRVQMDVGWTRRLTLEDSIDDLIHAATH